MARTADGGEVAIRGEWAYDLAGVVTGRPGEHGREGREVLSVHLEAFRNPIAFQMLCQKDPEAAREVVSVLAGR
jgi:hypothetical protein